MKVVRNAGGRPMLFLRRDQNPTLPEVEVEVLLNGEPHVARFVKVACNVVTRPGSDENRLPEILEPWFGEHAGEPGTGHEVHIPDVSARPMVLARGEPLR